MLATKFTNGSSGSPSILTTGNSRKNMVRSLEASLRRLRTDYVDLYWAHFPDTVTPMEEILGTFDDLVRSGKILHAGLSNFPAWRVARAVTLAELRGTTPVIATQVEYSLVERTAEREQLPMAEALGLGMALWSPLGGGLLSGKYRRSGEGRLMSKSRSIRVEDTEEKTAILDMVLAIADETQASPAQVAVAWLKEISKRSVSASVPIIGPRTVAQLSEYLGALELSLSLDQVERLDKVSVVALGTPQEAGRSARNRVLGGDASRFVLPVVPVA